MNKQDKVQEQIIIEDVPLNIPSLMKQMDGVFDTTPNTTAPTGKPKRLVDQVKLILNEGSGAAAGSFLVGELYKISSVGTTDFTAIGAKQNAVNTFFIATGIGSGSGSATRYTFRLYIYSVLFDTWRYVALSL